MNEELISKKLNDLKLFGMVKTLTLRLEQAQEERWSYSTFLDMIVSDEAEKRDNKQLMKRLGKSRIDPTKTMETFDFAFDVKLPCTLIKELSLCSFIEKKENIFLLGPSGTGKTHLAQALGHEAIRRGFDVLFYRCHELFEWINSGRGDGSHKKRLKLINTFPLLILDDFGLQSLLVQQQEDLYEVIASRYERSSTIITSNRDFSEWTTVFANPLLASAAIDRLVHKGTGVLLEGKSYRLAAFQERGRKKINNKLKEKV